MANAFDSLCDIILGKDAWRIKVRVARMWQGPSFLKPDQANTVEMVLIDEKVNFFICSSIMFAFSFVDSFVPFYLWDGCV
jgi:hypothetical protein